MRENAGYIALIDPALQDNDGTESSNLGDLIISESISENLRLLFPQKEIIRVSSHVPLKAKHREILKNSFLSFVGGTNLITSDMRGYRSFRVREGWLVWLFPGIKDLILFGPGWGAGYGEPVHFKTVHFYKKILHPDYYHSLRDQYSADKLMNETGIKTINTTCPTLWSVQGTIKKRAASTHTCLFTLTDYDPDPVADEKLVSTIFDHFEKVTFFPQGLNDIAYLHSLPVFKTNKSRIDILPHDYKEFKAFISAAHIAYIGTRLHSGIKCLQYGHEVMIVAIDHRATEIAKDTHLPVCGRTNFAGMADWLSGKDIFDKPFTLPHESILKWKSQFL